MPLSRTSQRFTAISKETFVRARWFLARYPLYEVIFRAIARHKLFDVRLLEVLLNSGAPLSRHLVQMLHVVRAPAELTRRRQSTRWAVHLEHAAYMAVLEKGKQLYGENMVFTGSALDDYVFDLALHASLQHSLRGGKEPDAGVPSRVVEALSSFRYMPLPLSFRCYHGTENSEDITSLQLEESPHKRVEKFLVKMPSAAPLVRANGEYDR